MNDLVKDYYLSHHGILGQKWGVRRYQNKDGSLTSAGKKRYERDVRDNLSKKKDNRIDTSNPNPKRWVKEDMERSKRLVDTSADLVKQVNSIEKETRSKPAVKKINLSEMSDKEMRDKINRELLERQYNNLFSEQNPVTISKGRAYVQNALAVGGDVLALTSSVLSIALAINELKS